MVVALKLGLFVLIAARVLFYSHATLPLRSDTGARCSSSQYFASELTSEKQNSWRNNNNGSSFRLLVMMSWT